MLSEIYTTVFICLSDWSLLSAGCGLLPFDFIFPSVFGFVHFNVGIQSRQQFTREKNSQREIRTQIGQYTVQNRDCYCKSITINIIPYQIEMTFRSLEMTHFQMIVPRGSAYQTVNTLGQRNMLHLQDNGNNMDRPFSQMVKRCDECLQKIAAISEALKKSSIDFDEYDESEPLFIEKLHEIWEAESKERGIDEAKLIDIYEERVLEEYNRFYDLNSRIEKMQKGKAEILERIACLETIKEFFGKGPAKRESQDYYISNAVDAYQMKGVSFIVGVVEKKSQLRLSRMIYRVSRGYACTKTLSDFKFFGLRDFDDEVMLVIYPTSDSSILERKLQKVMDTFCRSNYILKDMERENEQIKLEEAIRQYHESVGLLELGQKEMREFMGYVKGIECIEKWRIYLWKERTLYESLNKMDSRDQFYIANIYVPAKSIKELADHIARIVPSPTLHQVALGKPPTAFDSNSYTMAPQEIVNTYGVPRYQEINPSIFTTVTFPFFFGVMFGDIGHGLILLCMGLYLVFNDEEVKKGALKMFSQLRYMVLMMGFFAMYCGFIYNDIIGFNFNLFGSCYSPPLHPNEEDEKMSISLYPKPDCVYPVGVDPVWGRAENNLVFVNSLKMKISVIIAILHMTVGVCCKAANSLFFRKRLDFYLEFIPQFIFLVGLFGYMDFLIVFKWLKAWDEVVDDVPPQEWAPSIITTMMNLGLALGKTSTLHDGTSNMWGERGNSSQDTVQILLLLVGFICIPIMLLPKPIIEIRRNNRVKRGNPLVHQEDDDVGSLKEKLNPSSEDHHNEEGEDKHEDSSQIFVHQLIETIQFVLGAVSNTASYLRLWALSLAHSQLSQVFWNKTAGMMAGSAQLLELPMLLVGFWMVAWITFGLIICMDSMECFLHSLRLHWVEFQNKFYKGDGYAYEPLHYKKVIIGHKTVSIL